MHCSCVDIGVQFSRDLVCDCLWPSAASPQTPFRHDISSLPRGQQEEGDAARFAGFIGASPEGASLNQAEVKRRMCLTCAAPKF